MAEAGLQEVDTYISRHHNTVAEFIVTRPIMELCLGEERRPGSSATNRWWDQDGLNVKEMRMAAWEVERTEGGEKTDRTETEMDTETD